MLSVRARGAHPRIVRQPRNVTQNGRARAPKCHASGMSTATQLRRAHIPASIAKQCHWRGARPPYQLNRLHDSRMRPQPRDVPRLLCTKTRFVSIAAIPHILLHMCRQIGFALHATTKRGGLPSGFAAGMACRRFDLKVELQAIRLLFDIPAPSTFVKRRRAIPTFGSRQAP